MSWLKFKKLTIFLLKIESKKSIINHDFTVPEVTNLLSLLRLRCTDKSLLLSLYHKIR